MKSIPGKRLKRKSTVSFRPSTTLGKLFEAIQDEVSPSDDKLVVAVISHLCQTGQLKFTIR